MKYEIETYKGQLIEYDDEYDKFICDISIEDKWKTTKRLSLADVRKEIDNFIKLNSDFKPFKVLELNRYGSNDFDVLVVAAIRTDGKFVTHSESSNKNKSYSSKEDMKRWMNYDSEAVRKKNELNKEFEKIRRDYGNKIIELTKSLTPADLSKYEHIINAE